MQNSLAPIVLFVYNRPNHTLQTLESLKNNELANDSSLYVFCDGPKKDSSKENAKKIEEVRAVIHQKKWCKEVIIKERPSNMGLANSVIDAVTEITNEFGRAIVLEDDIITGKFFLKFMNEALETYKNIANIYGISGYCYFDNLEPNSSYLLPIGSSWGWATWNDKWNCFEKNASSLLKDIDKLGLRKEFDFGGYPFYSMLKENCQGKNDSWAIRFYASFFLKSGYFLFPNKSLVQNIGFDYSGTHCSDEAYFDPNIYHGELEVIFSNPSLNLKTITKFKKQFESIFINGNNRNTLEKILSLFQNIIGKKL